MVLLCWLRAVWMRLSAVGCLDKFGALSRRLDRRETLVGSGGRRVEVFEDVDEAELEVAGRWGSLSSVAVMRRSIRSGCGSSVSSTCVACHRSGLASRSLKDKRRSSSFILMVAARLS